MAEEKGLAGIEGEGGRDGENISFNDTGDRQNFEPHDDEVGHLWTLNVVSSVSDWQRKIWLMVRLKTMVRTFKIKATERASRARTEKVSSLESQKWAMFNQCKK